MSGGRMSVSPHRTSVVLAGDKSPLDKLSDRTSVATGELRYLSEFLSMKRESYTVDTDYVIVKLYHDLKKYSEDDDYTDLLTGYETVELFETLKLVAGRLALKELEIFIFTEFLQEHNPNLLLGLDQQMTDYAEKKKDDLTFSKLDSRSMRSQSYSVLSAGHARGKDFILTLSTKRTIAATCRVRLEPIVTQMQRQYQQTILNLRSQLQELKCCAADAINMQSNFKLHFGTNIKRYTAIDEAKRFLPRFFTYVSNWLREAQDLLCNIRMRYDSCNEKCNELHHMLISKKDIRGTLSPAAYKLTEIKYHKTKELYDRKYIDLQEAKAFNAESIIQRTQITFTMNALENKTAKLNKRIKELELANERINNEIDEMKISNGKDVERINELRQKLKDYETPKIPEYINLKNKFLALEKEEKTLIRKCNLAHMKYTNLHKKLTKVKSV